MPLPAPEDDTSDQATPVVTPPGAVSSSATPGLRSNQPSRPFTPEKTADRSESKATSRSEPQQRRRSREDAAFEKQKLNAAYKAYREARKMRMMMAEKQRLRTTIARGRGTNPDAGAELARLRKLQE